MAWSDFTGIFSGIVDAIKEKPFGAVAIVFLITTCVAGYKWNEEANVHAAYVKEVREVYVTKFESQRLRDKLDSCEAKMQRIADKREAENQELEEFKYWQIQLIDSLKYEIKEYKRELKNLQK